MNVLVAAYSVIIGVFMVGFWGFLVATMVNRPGFYAGRKNWPMVGVFTALAILTVAAIAVVLFLGGHSVWVSVRPDGKLHDATAW